jgi:hypothetical protein
MPGIFHACFGLTVGLLVWKLSEGKNGEKRFSLPLIFVFAINNYIGPDFKAILERIGEALGSPPLVALGEAVHSYTGFLLFALPYAVAWYAILLGIEQARARSLVKAGIAGSEPNLHASYPKVLLMVIAGGMMHHFVDSIGHSTKGTITGSPGIYYPVGRFILIPNMIADFWLAYLVVIATIAIAAVLYLFVGWKRNRFTIKAKILTAFTRETLTGAFIVGIVVLNVVLMYDLMAYGNLVVMDDGDVMFYLGNLLRAAAIMFDKSAIWWIAVTTAPTLVLFFLSHAKAWRFSVARHVIRADLFVVICYICSLLVGYALQPVIGNISGTERDAGALIYTWSTIGSTLLAFILARNKQMPNREVGIAPPSTS